MTHCGVTRTTVDLVVKEARVDNVEAPNPPPAPPPQPGKFCTPAYLP
jgi:hypothetical protein